MIPDKIKSVDDLELPDSLLDFCHLPMGLVLVTGPTGSGKSTTLSTLVQFIADQYPVHIVTIEDPIEFLLHDSAGTISQREVGTDTPSFYEALKNSLRQDPDVIMVGEMRDPETVSTVITAAETGHLVFSTLHTNDTGQTIDRILDNFPPGQQTQVRFQLSQVLRGVVSMQLVRRRDGSGRVAALEILRASPDMEKLIASGRTSEMLERIESSVGHYHMQSMNQSLVALVVNGTITYQEAMRSSTDPDDLDLKLRRFFPKLLEQEKEMSSSADYSQIFELLQYRKLYEEQEEKIKIQLAEKDELVADLRQRLARQGDDVERLRRVITEADERVAKAENEKDRVAVEAKQRVDKLQERVRELNQQLTARVYRNRSGRRAIPVCSRPVRGVSSALEHESKCR